MDQEHNPRERSFVRELVPDWQPTRKQARWTARIVIVLVLLLGILTLIGLLFDITLWEWVKLLIVPAVIAAGGLWFNAQQREREHRIANVRAQDEALQAYLDQMSDLLIPNKERPSLYDEHPTDVLTSVARARTLTVLPRLDGHRKARVVQFLYEAGLILTRAEEGEHTVLDLSGADLRGADLSEANLTQANLSEADLRGADLSWAELYEAYLRMANLSEANLNGAHLSKAKLINTNLNGTYLGGADLSKANLDGAFLKGANLTGADLSEAYLSEVYLGGADLTSARGWTEGQMRWVLSLEDATMPNGQKYEDWLKDKEGRGKDVENE